MCDNAPPAPPKFVPLNNTAFYQIKVIHLSVLTKFMQTLLEDVIASNTGHSFFT